MPLTTTCAGSVGRELFVLPYYGYGRSRMDTSAPPGTILDALGPEPFRFRVDECIYCDQDLMGVSGAVVKSKDILEGFWCCCLLRNPDERNFTTRCGEYIVWIAQSELQIIPEPYPRKALGDWVVPDKTAF